MAVGCVQPLCVNSTTDNAANPAPGSLRYAVLNAPLGATITFGPGLNGQTIFLDFSSPNNYIKISQDVTIQGPGSGQLTINGGATTRIFFVAGGNVTISGLTLTNGMAKGGDGAAGNGGGGGAAGMGGAIFLNGGVLTLNSVILTGNRAVGGNGGGGMASGVGGGGGGFAGNGTNASGGPPGDLVCCGGFGGSGGGSSGNPGGFGGGGGGGGGGAFGGYGGAGGFGGGGGGGGAANLGGPGGGGTGGRSGGSGASGGAAGGPGGAGAGLGGAIFASAGTLRLLNVTFGSNSSAGGVGGSGAGSGQAKGAALFICTSSFCGAGHDATAAASGSNAFGGNVAPDAGSAPACPVTDNADVCGLLTTIGPVVKLAVTTPPTVTSGGPFAAAVTAQDGNGNTVFTYADMVHFSSTDPIATLPPDTSLAQGAGTFSVTLKTTGSQSITVNDTATPGINGTSIPITVTPGRSFAAVGASPPAGSGPSQIFTFTYADTDGWQSFDVVNVLINNFLDGRGSCYMAYSRPLNVLYLVNDPGTALLAGLPLNGTGSVGNSQCTINGVGSSASGSGSSLILTLNISFSPGYAGNRVIYLAARDISQNNTGWQPLGTWNIPGNPQASPAPGAVNPARGSGTAGIFTFTFLDTKGWPDLGVVNVLMNSSLDGRQACYLAYSRSQNVLYLVNDAGTALLPGLVLNGTGTQSNSQCTVLGVQSSASAGQDTLTLTVGLTFTAAFSGNRVIYTAARDNTDANSSGWQALGSWTVQ